YFFSRRFWARRSAVLTWGARGARGRGAGRPGCAAIGRCAAGGGGAAPRMPPPDVAAGAALRLRARSASLVFACLAARSRSRASAPPLKTAPVVPTASPDDSSFAVATYTPGRESGTDAP